VAVVVVLVVVARPVTSPCVLVMAVLVLVVVVIMITIVMVVMVVSPPVLMLRSHGLESNTRPSEAANVRFRFREISRDRPGYTQCAARCSRAPRLGLLTGAMLWSTIGGDSGKKHRFLWGVAARH
jgi:hypothetical protein